MYRLSEARFKIDPLAFTHELNDGTPVFNEDSYWEYLEYIESEMVNNLKVMRKVSGRARPRRRTEFQAELTLLRNYGFISQSRYRLGVGVPIDRDAAQYLANVADDRFIARVWTRFWFEWVLTPEVITPWVVVDGRYVPPGSYTRLARDDGRAHSQIWEGRTSSLKEKLCALLNGGEIDEATAWQYFIAGIPASTGQGTQGIRARAHSYREDLDSALAQLAWIDDDGRPTSEGYKFVAICERFWWREQRGSQGVHGCNADPDGPIWLDNKGCVLPVPADLLRCCWRTRSTSGAAT